MLNLKEKFKKTIIYILNSQSVLSFSSFYPFILFYLIKNNIILFPYSEIINYLIYFIFGLIFSKLCLWAVLNKNYTDHQDKINKIKPLEFIYIPSYLIFVIISLNLNCDISYGTIFLFLIIFIIWIKLESVSFFNFYWLLFDYRFYEISTDKSNYILISKQKDIKNNKILTNLELKRINNYTFIELKKNKKL